MRTLCRAVATFGLYGLLCMGCRFYGTGSSAPPVGVPSSKAADRSVSNGRPVVPPQFTPVVEADWDKGKPLVGVEIKCQNDKARIFDCHAIDLLAYLPMDSIGGGRALLDIWGWTDSVTGREFALVTRGGDDPLYDDGTVRRHGGTSFIEITDPLNPRYLGTLPAGGREVATSIKVYKNHAFIASVQNGLQVFDLTQLRTVSSGRTTFQETAHYDKVANIHTIAINEATGFAYAAGSFGGGEVCGSGLHMIDIRTPANPTFAGCHVETLLGRRPGSGYIHETVCVIYRGPHQQYRGRELCFNSAGEAVSITDVTDKKRPKTIGIGDYPNVQLTHQGWLSEDQHYFFLYDEYDEDLVAKQKGWDQGRARMMVFDVTNLSDPVLVKEFFGPAPSVDHTLFVRGRYIYQSHYDAGLRIVDTSDPQELNEVGYFKHAEGVSGSNYPYFTKNADVIVFAATTGFFVVRYRGADGR